MVFYVFFCVFYLPRASLFILFILWVLVFVLCCQYQCKWLPGKTCLWNDLLCVEREVKVYTHSLKCLLSLLYSCFFVLLLLCCLF